VIRDLRVRPIDRWPDGWRARTNADRKPNPFKTKAYDLTLHALAYELDQLDIRAAHLQVDCSAVDLRRDGMLRAHARVDHPGVILTADTRVHGVLTYPCDTFAGRWSNDPPAWQINLRAIALGLEALRKVDRYGIAERGQQYAGFGALPMSPPTEGPMSVDDAVIFIGQWAWGQPDVDPQEVVDDLDAAFRAASKRLHPDTGGDPALFRRLITARQIIKGTAP
jgi:hypothetical protein